MTGCAGFSMNATYDRVKEKQTETLFGSEAIAGKDEWLTPPEIITALGPFDLDPCAPIKRPWDMAGQHFTVLDNGLNKPWSGRVWCNPPYGTQAGSWLRRCARHGNAIALVFARTETSMFFDAVWDHADALFFFKGRLNFYHVDGKRGSNAGAPSVLIAYGRENADRLMNVKLDGKGIRLKV